LYKTSNQCRRPLWATALYDKNEEEGEFMMRKLFSVIMMVLSLMAVSCGKAPMGGEIVGKWKNDVLKRTIEFRQDGTVTDTYSTLGLDMVQDGTYKQDGKTFEVQFTSMKQITDKVKEEPLKVEPATWKVSMKGDKLSITMGAGGGQKEAFLFDRTN